MGTTRIEQAIDEQEIDGDEFDLSCTDVRLARLAHDSSSGGDSASRTNP